MQNSVNTHSQASTLFAKAHVAGAQKDAALGENGEPIDFAALLAAGMPIQADGLDDRLAAVTKATAAKLDATLEPGKDKNADTDKDSARDALPLGNLADLARAAQQMPAQLMGTPASVPLQSATPTANGIIGKDLPAARTKPDAQLAGVSAARATPISPGAGPEVQQTAQVDDRTTSTAPSLPSSLFNGLANSARESSMQFDKSAVAAAAPQAAAPVATENPAVASVPAAPAHIPAHTTATASMPPIQAPLGTAQWDAALSQRVVWSVNQGNQMAEIHITPPELGPIAMTLSLDAQQSGQQASIHFVSAHAPVREAIEAALPRLREMMADAGIALGNATVGSESFQQSTGHHAHARHGSHQNQSKGFAIDTPAARDTQRGQGLVDLFA